MPHLHRFYLPEKFTIGVPLRLEGEEAHHALHVVRLRRGDEIAVINGRGAEARATVEDLTRREVVLACVDMENTPPATNTLTILQAALHQPKAADFLVRHGTEVGVAHFVFFRARHSERAPASTEKLERVAIEAMKQSGRRWLPTFELADNLAEALAFSTGPILIAAMDTAPVPIIDAIGVGETTLLVGPEGDFAPEEVQQAIAAGAKPISLGPYTYRSEVAALLAATLIQYHAAQLGPRA